MPVPEQELEAEAAGIARSIGYQAGIPVAAAHTIILMILEQREQIRHLEFRLSQLEHIGPHLRDREVRTTPAPLKK